MKTINLKDLEINDVLYKEIDRVLTDGGLVCLPCGSNYRIVADFTSEKAVNHLLQSKRRTRHAPSLVFVSDKRMLSSIAANVDDATQQLVHRFWPGPLTILFDANPDLPKAIVKPLTKSNGKLGVRIPSHPLIQKVITTLGKPLLVSSANPERKKGASSPAQIRKNFFGRVDLFIDAGDLTPEPPSTVVELKDGKVVIKRVGHIPADAIVKVIEEY